MMEASCAYIAIHGPHHARGEPAPAVINSSSDSAFAKRLAGWWIERFGFARARLPRSDNEMAL
jgi:hypothetical protein